MVTEINNFICVRCREKISYADLKTAVVTLSRDHKGIVMICEKCIPYLKGAKYKTSKDPNFNDTIADRNKNRNPFAEVQTDD